MESVAPAPAPDPAEQPTRDRAEWSSVRDAGTLQADDGRDRAGGAAPDVNNNANDSYFNPHREKSWLSSLTVGPASGGVATRAWARQPITLLTDKGSVYLRYT